MSIRRCHHSNPDRYHDKSYNALVCVACGGIIKYLGAQVVSVNKKAATINCPINWVPVEVSQEILDKAKISEKVTLPCGHTVPAKEVLKRVDA
jgi:hypothetical protein